MPQLPLLYLIAPILFLLCIGVLILWYKIKFSARKKKILKNIPYHLKKIEHLPKTQQILEYDKVLDKCLYALGYKGSTGQKMIQYGKSRKKNFYNRNNIWTAHKLRNRIAHEIGFEPSSAEYQVAKQYFLQEIRKICR